jgi:hypothetical protein
VDVEQIRQALDQLDQCNLVAATAGSGISRRDLVRKTALVGAAAMATPLITTVLTPHTARAQDDDDDGCPCNPVPCTTDDDCKCPGEDKCDKGGGDEGDCECGGPGTPGEGTCQCQ